MARSDPQLNFRIPVDLRERLETAAAHNKRSLTQELVERLEASFVSAAFPARDQEDLHAMMDISVAQLDFHMAQNQVAEARDEFSRARMRYDALVIQNNAARNSDLQADQLVDMKEQRMAALEEAERAHLKLKEAESGLYAAQKKLADYHVARMRRSAAHLTNPRVEITAKPKPKPPKKTPTNPPTAN